MIKLSGLEMETSYEFYIVLVTSAGTFQSNTVQVQTHNIQNLSGIHVCMDPFLHASEVEELKKCCDRIDAKWTDEISIECTHLLCHQAQGPTFDMAVKLNVAVVKPEWLKACEALGKVQPIVSYYVDPNNK
jgi:NAD-dependent DNA ligase